jgi:hypothetical protein
LPAAGEWLGSADGAEFVAADTLGAGEETLGLEVGLPASTNKKANVPNARMIAVAKVRVNFFMAASPPTYRNE